MNYQTYKQLLLIFLGSILYALSGQAQTIFVTEQGTGDGSSWENASSDLLNVLQSATAGAEIWVAKGTYHPVICTDCGTAEKEIAFVLNDGVSLYGGFSGSESSLTDRNPSIHKTILDGDIGLPEDMSDNSYTILEIGSVQQAIVDGFIFQNGNADNGVGDDLGVRNSGGAIHIAANGTDNFSAPTINNCIFKNNRADTFGGAINVYAGFGGHGEAQITNCRFEGNFAPKKGGAIFQYAAFDGLIEGTIANCTFSQNASTEGGAMYVLSSGNGVANLLISQTTFEYNWSVSEGGALVNHAAGGQNNSQFTQCTFYNNSGEYGGGIYNDGRFAGNCSPSFTKCLFKANTADNGGAGIYNNGYQGIVDPIFDNCTFELNYTQQSGGAIFNNGVEGSCSPIFERCYFMENVVEMYGGGMYNFGKTGESSPSIINCLFRRNKADSGGSVYNYGGQNGDSSPNIQNCTFTLNEARVGPCIYNQGSEITGNVKPLVSNCIFWNNEAYSGFGLVFQNGFAEPTIQHCLIPFDDCDLLNTDQDSEVICGNGMLFNVDPLFTDEANLNFRPLANSPIVDAGIIPGGMNLDMDLDGYPRIYNSILDLGAYEFGDIAMPSIISQSLSGVHCLGDSLVLEINAAGQGALSYQWFKDDLSLTSEQSNILILPNLNGSQEGMYHCEVTLAAQTIGSEAIAIALNPPNETVLDLDPSATQFCAGENEISVGIQISNGGYFPDIAWVLNNEIVSTEFTPYQFTAQDGDVLYATYNAFQLCYADDDFTSESIIFTEEEMVVPQITLQLDAAIYCENENIVAMVDIENGGAGAVINWFNNGALIASGDSEQYVSSDFEDGDMLSAQLISSLSCVSNPMVNSTAQSIAIQATTFPELEIIDNNDSLCIDRLLTFTAAISDAGEEPELEWMVDGIQQSNVSELLEITFDQIGSHSIIAHLTADDLCPNEAVVTVDLDLELANCLSSTFNSTYSKKLKIWPNPAQSLVTISWDLTLDDPISYQLKDASGRVISRQNVHPIGQDSRIELPVENLQNGCYILEFHTGNQHFSKPLIILK